MKPLITLAISTYNHEHYIRAALEGAFSQTYQPLEIIISDDCSEDETFNIIQRQARLYRGNHQIRTYRNPCNLGLARHLNHILKKAKGELILFAAGDDISYPDRTAKTYEAWLSSGKKTLAIFTQARVIDHYGRRHGLFIPEVTSKMLTAEWMIKHYPVAHGFGLAISRQLIELFGPLPEDISREDVVIPIRAAILEPLLYLEKPLVYYRRHSQNLSKVPGVDIVGKNELFNYIKRHSKGHIAICRSWIRDLTVAERLFPTKREKFEILRRYAREKLHYVVIEDRLLEATPIQRFKILVGEYLCKTNRKKLLEWVLIFHIPTLYLSYKKYRRCGLVKYLGLRLK